MLNFMRDLSLKLIIDGMSLPGIVTALSFWLCIPVVTVSSLRIFIRIMRYSLFSFFSSLESLFSSKETSHTGEGQDKYQRERMVILREPSMVIEMETITLGHVHILIDTLIHGGESISAASRKLLKFLFLTGLTAVGDALEELKSELEIMAIRCMEVLCKDSFNL